MMEYIKQNIELLILLPIVVLMFPSPDQIMFVEMFMTRGP